METGITTNPITHGLVTSNGTHHLITDKTNKMLEEASLDDLVELDDGSKIKTSAIMNILPIAKYWDFFPNRKPAPEPMNKFPDMDFQDFRSDKLSRNGLESIIRGIQRAIDEFRKEGREPKKALALMDKALKAYKERYSPQT